MIAETVASPLSTGGAGTFFEQHVAAYWLTQLLVRAIPPVLIDTSVVEVSFQTEHLGWSTDDFLVVCEGMDAKRRQLAGQVKRNFSISSNDQDCVKAILDFWKDYNSADHFSPTQDRLLLVVQRGTDVLLNDFGGLLECARGASSAAAFEGRLSIPGFVSKRAIRYCEEIRKIIADYEQRSISASDLWEFIRALYLLSLDLDTQTRQTEAQLKALLAYTVVDRDVLNAAQASWNSLLALASAAMPRAGTLRWEDMPLELRKRHGALGQDEDKILRSLREHTAPILRRIRSTIGATLHLERATLVQRVIDELESAQVVIISGSAGCGKSAIAKDVSLRLSHNHFVFAFRVEEFAQPHIDSTLHSAQIPGNTEALAAILSTQTQKLVLVESVERLLEKATRDAFSDLMVQAAGDPDLRLMLTCRDYSTEQVRASFLRPSGLTHTVITVPALDDTELAEVVSTVPVLAEPLSNDRLRNILRNPYFLDKALQLPWHADRPPPESERDFRILFWQQVVRGDSSLSLGMPRQREDVFQEIAIRRARALSEYVSTNDLDPTVVASLRRDSLISSPDDNLSLAATAHDVLEDWAILQWLDELRLPNDSSLHELSIAIGTHPAIRRSYRKWLSELLEREPTAADGLFTAATSETGISSQFSDDTLVSLLKAPLASDLLARREARIVANGNAVLKRIIHLLRVACVVTPDWLRGASGYGSIFNVPDGPAWLAVLKLAHGRMHQFMAMDQLLLLGLIEDATRGVSWWAPELDSAEFVAGIGYALLPELKDYRQKDARCRLLKVLAKIPKADPVRFEAILRGAETTDSRDHVAEDFLDILLTGSDGAFAFRDVPVLMASVVAEYVLLTENEVRKGRYHEYSTQVGIYFGIKELRQGFFPASALKGGWLPLLRNHSRIGLDLYYKIFNQSVDWYVNPRVQNSLEPAWETELTFVDGHIVKQWGNPRLWNCYRGTSVSPYVLQSMLMALETWLLEVAALYPSEIEQILLDILRQSHSASMSAVVASVAIAQPHSAPEALLVLLSSPDFVRFDRERMANEAHASVLNQILPELQADKKIYREERQKADSLSHRRNDLEWAIACLQLGPMAARVHEVLDRHLAALPAVSDRDRSDLVWQLALQRMDLRQYKISKVGGAPSDGLTAVDEVEETYLVLEPQVGDSEVSALVEESTQRLNEMNNLLSVWMWGVKAFKRELSKEERDVWREKLASARTVDRDRSDEVGGRNGPGVVAAVCIRDHWDQMDDDDHIWCSEVVCSEIMRSANHWNHLERVQRHEMAADRACASVIPLLLSKKLVDAMFSLARSALAAAITHPITEVRWFATWGLNEEIWRTDRKLVFACVEAIAEEATSFEDFWRDTKHRHRPEEIEDRLKKITLGVRERFWSVRKAAVNISRAINFADRAGAEACSRILTILLFAPNEQFSVEAFEHAARSLVNEWERERKDRDHLHERNFESEHAVADRIQRFAMQTTPDFASRILSPILDAVDKHPRETYSIVQGLTVLEDQRPRTTQYWHLWRLFAEKVKGARWVAWLNREHPMGSEMLSAIFMTSYWKENIRHWKSVEGHSHHVDALFEALPPTSIVLDDYLRFLYHIGEQSLPEAFQLISRAVHTGGPLQMLEKNNTVFLLEVLLQRHVYGRPLELKQAAALREAVIYLLDALVESGSSAAFRMRDDFVTPVG